MRVMTRKGMFRLLMFCFFIQGLSISVGIWDIYRGKYVIGIISIMINSIGIIVNIFSLRRHRRLWTKIEANRAEFERRQAEFEIEMERTFKLIEVIYEPPLLLPEKTETKVENNEDSL